MPMNENIQLATVSRDRLLRPGLKLKKHLINNLLRRKYESIQIYFPNDVLCFIQFINHRGFFRGLYFVQNILIELLFVFRHFKITNGLRYRIKQYFIDDPLFHLVYLYFNKIKCGNFVRERHQQWHILSDNHTKPFPRLPVSCQQVIIVIYDRCAIMEP